MPEEALGTGQDQGQPVSSASQGGNDSYYGATESQPSVQNAPETEQPLSLTKAQLEQYISDAINAQKQNWLNEAYRNTQSMNDKFERRVNSAIEALQASGIQADRASAAKFLKAQDQRYAEAVAQAQAQQQQNAIAPEYAQFLNRFGINPQQARDTRLQGAWSLEQEYGIQLTKEDPEYQEYFGDPNKRFSAYQFQRDYERALEKKRARSQENPQGNIAGMPSMSGTGRKSDAIPNLMSSNDIYDIALSRRNMR